VGEWAGWEDSNRDAQLREALMITTLSIDGNQEVCPNARTQALAVLTE